MIELADVKKQLVLDCDAEDAYLQLLVDAAIDNLSQLLNRKLYRTEVELQSAQSAPEYSMAITPSLKIAVLMIVTDLYENRGTTSTLTLKDNPAFQRMIAPYRVFTYGN